MISAKASTQAVISEIDITVDSIFKSVIAIEVHCFLLKLDIVAAFFFFLKKLSSETLIPSVTPLVSGVHTKKTWGLTELFSPEENFELTFLRSRNKYLISENI